MVEMELTRAKINVASNYVSYERAARPSSIGSHVRAKRDRRRESRGEVS